MQLIVNKKAAVLSALVATLSAVALVYAGTSNYQCDPCYQEQYDYGGGASAYAEASADCDAEDYFDYVEAYAEAWSTACVGVLNIAQTDDDGSGVWGAAFQFYFGYPYDDAIGGATCSGSEYDEAFLHGTC